MAMSKRIREEASIIANDANRMAIAYSYWRQQFEELTKLPNILCDIPARRFIDILPNQRLSKLLPERTHLFPDEDGMLKNSGCLLSSDEMSEHIGITNLIDSVKLFETAGKACSEMQNLQNNWKPQPGVLEGIVAIRELYDALRRIVYCEQNARINVNVPELLAIYREEGGLVVPPLEDSYQHSPLIETTDIIGPCRSSIVTLSNPAMRPNFRLRYQMLNASGLKKATNFFTAVMNLLVTGGLDTIVWPRRAINDELDQLIHGIFHAPKFPYSQQDYNIELGQEVRRTQSDIAEWMTNLFEGFTKAILELSALESNEKSPKNDALSQLLDESYEHYKSVVEAHEGIEIGPPGWARILVRNGDSCTKECLSTQADWYQSRKSVSTLLAIQDRDQRICDGLTLTPFVSYLRFHAGDINFMGYLLRIAINLHKIRKGWQQDWNKPIRSLVGTFEEAIKKSKYDAIESEDLKKQLQETGNKWFFIKELGSKNLGKYDELNWHHAGLFKMLIDSGADERIRSWQKNENLLIKLLANCSSSAIQAVAALRLLEPICIAFEYTPIWFLKSLGIKSIHLIKAHSFERLRIVYEAAWEKAVAK